MVHILTVHWNDDKWIDIQIKFLKKTIVREFRTYAFLTGKACRYHHKFHFTLKSNVRDHATKLNTLAEYVTMESNDEDILIFLDGDAFPIGNILRFIDEKLQEHKLLAIQRIENCGDIQPHPSFCATTAGFWKEIKGDWRPGYQWKNNVGEYKTDVGGNLLKNLNDFNVNWYKLKRTKGLGDHPLWFGIYEDLIYHHGAGFRKPKSRIDVQKSNKLIKYYYAVLKCLPDVLTPYFDLTNLIYFENVRMSRRIYTRINTDEHIFNLERSFK